MVWMRTEEKYVFWTVLTQWENQPKVIIPRKNILEKIGAFTKNLV